MSISDIAQVSFSEVAMVGLIFGLWLAGVCTAFIWGAVLPVIGLLWCFGWLS